MYSPTIVYFTLALLAKAVGAAPLTQQHRRSLKQASKHYVARSTGGTCHSSPAVVVEQVITQTRTITTTVTVHGGSNPTGTGGITSALPTSAAPVSPGLPGLPWSGQSPSGSAGDAVTQTGSQSGTRPTTAASGAGSFIASSASEWQQSSGTGTTGQPAKSPSTHVSASVSGSTSTAAPSPGSSNGAVTASSTPSASSGSGDGLAGSPQGRKRGIGYNDASLLKAFSGKVSWCHNWEQTNAGVPQGMAYYPTLWNGEEQRIARWKASADAAIERGDNVLFSFVSDPVAPGTNPS